MNGPTIHRTSPQIAQPATISSTMLDVIIALVPALAMAVFLFGIRVLALTAVSVGTCVLAEYGYRRLRGQSNTIGDLSACVTGLLLAPPPTGPLSWAACLPLSSSNSFMEGWAATSSIPLWRAGPCCVPSPA